MLAARPMPTLLGKMAVGALLHELTLIVTAARGSLVVVIWIEPAHVLSSVHLRERGRSSSVGFPFGAEDFGHLAWSIGQAGKYRRQGDARGDAGIGEKAD